MKNNRRNRKKVILSLRRKGFKNCGHKIAATVIEKHNVARKHNFWEGGLCKAPKSKV